MQNSLKRRLETPLSRTNYFILCIFFLNAWFPEGSIAQNNWNGYPEEKSAMADSGMVVTAHPLASAIGVDILKQGGNAVDAAIAVQFALAVCYPGAGNIGGGGFMMVRTADGVFKALDFREKAPEKATSDMYLDSKGNPVTEKSLFGHLAAGVPGSVDGMITAFEKYSRLKDWKKLLQPAVDLAENGYFITKREAESLNFGQQKFKSCNRFRTAFQKKSSWKECDLLIQKALASTLRHIRDKGRAGFYEGPVAKKIVKEMHAGRGLISFQDLKNYKSVWRNPVISDYRGYKIVSMPPPSSGGVALIQLLKMIEPYPVNQFQFLGKEHVHIFAEAERRVFADRAKYLGDPDFYKVPVETLLDKSYLARRMSDFDPVRATPSEQVTHGVIEHEETTHFSIVDKWGNAVSLTTTLNGNYGSFTVVKGAGFLLNNEMDDFSVKPGVPNLYGLVGSEANKIQPGKRMLSSMTPTIIEKSGNLFMVVGTPGGSTIITSVFQVISNVIDFGMNIHDAVQVPRFHHQWLPDVLRIEEGAIPAVSEKILQEMGYTTIQRGQIGRVEAIQIGKDGKLHGAADRRGDDSARGY